MSATSELPSSVYAGGEIGVDMDSWMWKKNMFGTIKAPGYYCYTEPASGQYVTNTLKALTKQYNITGTALDRIANEIPLDCGMEKLPGDQCSSICTTLGFPADKFSFCPLNQLGCCECGYFTPKARPVTGIHSPESFVWDSQNFYGWLNVSFWMTLFLMLLPLLFLRTGLLNRLWQGGKVAANTTRSAVKVERLTNLWTNAMRYIALAGMLIAGLYLFVWKICMNELAYNTVWFVFSSSAFGIFLHVFCGSIWAITGALQFFAPFRQRYPVMHRRIGRIFVANQILNTIGLLVLFCSPIMALGFSEVAASLTFLAYWDVSFYLAIKHAIKGDIDSHRRWMTRHMFLGMSTFSSRFVTSPALINSVFQFLSTPTFMATYFGNFWQAVCSSDTTEIDIEFRNSTQYLSESQRAYFCQASLSPLYSQWFLQYAILFFVIFGIIAAEVWLWAAGLQAHQIKTRTYLNMANATKGHTGTLNIVDNSKTESESVEIELDSKTGIAKRTYLLRFRLPNRSGPGVVDAVLVPTLGHVNLKSIGTGLTHTSRPFSPIQSIGNDPGYISFIVRDAQNNGLSTFMTQKLEIGDKMCMYGPFASGHGQAAEYDILPRGENTLVLAAGTGIVPFIDFAKTVMATQRAAASGESYYGNMELLYKDRFGQQIDFDDIIFGKDSCLEEGRSSIPGTISTQSLGIFKHQVLFDTDEYNKRVDEAINGGKFDSVLVCGPVRFNFAIKKRLLSHTRGLKITCIGTDGR